jgi:hypothetical protein
MKKPKQHFGVRRSPVPGKVCLPYVTGHRQLVGKNGILKTWIHKDTKGKFRPKRAEKKLWEFFLAVYRGKHQTKGYHIDPAPPGKAEAYAKKAMSIIKGPGLGEWEMFWVADEFEEWWKGEVKKYVKELKEGGKWIEWKEIREKGEKHRRAGKNWKKGLKSKDASKDAELTRNIEDFIKKSRKEQNSLGFH